MTAILGRECRMGKGLDNRAIVFLFSVSHYFGFRADFNFFFLRQTGPGLGLSLPRPSDLTVPAMKGVGTGGWPRRSFWGEL